MNEALKQEGTFQMIDVQHLCIDHSYQREEISEKYVQKIARNFEWSAFAALTVMRRITGQVFVVDGQHRLAAAKQLGVRAVPCMVYLSSGQHHEAEAFVQLNVNRKAVSAIDRYNARLSAGLSPETEMQDMLESLELHIGNGQYRGSVKCVSHVMRNFKTDPAATAAALATEQLLGDNIRYTWAVHNGLWYLEHNNIRTRPHVAKIQQLGGYAAIEQKQKEVAIESGYLQLQARHSAIALLRLINYRCRNRIELPQLTE